MFGLPPFWAVVGLNNGLNPGLLGPIVAGAYCIPFSMSEFMSKFEKKKIRAKEITSSKRLLVEKDSLCIDVTSEHIHAARVCMVTTTE